MTALANRYMFAIDRRQVETKPLEPFSVFADMANVVHLHLFGTFKYGAVIQQPALGRSWPQNWQDIDICFCIRCLLHLLHGLVEEMDV